MEICHETGYVLAGLFSGAALGIVELRPWQLSRTGFTLNPHPGLAVWAGPLAGILIPLAVWLILRKWNRAYLLRFFAGFALIANGVYIGIGGFWKIGDCFEMLKTGTPLWSMVLFGISALSAGLWLWNGQTREFPGAIP